MILYFAGAEIPDYQDRLERLGVAHRAVSFKRVDERPGEPTIRSGARYWVDHGIPYGLELEDEAFDAYLGRYITWLTQHDAQIDGALEFDFANTGQRARAWDFLVDALGSQRVWRVWHPKQGVEELRRVVALQPPGLVVIGTGVHKDRQVMALLASQRASGMGLHIHMAPNPEHISRLRPGSITTMSWNAPLRFGELITPRGSGIQRFQPPHDNRTYAIVSERAQSLGLDPDRIKAGDPEAAVQLAVATLLRFEDQCVVHKDDPWEAEDLDTGSEVVEHNSSEERKPAALTTRPLPGMGLSLQRHEEPGSDGLVEVRDVPVLNSSAESYRKCDTCYLSASCPAYIPGNSCAFHLPVELRTKTQVKALVDTMLEIQTARVAFGRYAEEINGGYPDPTVGKEMDRLMKMVSTRTEMEQARESLTVSVESKSTGSGILSALFGQRATERLDRLPDGGLNESQTNVVMGEIAGVLEPGDS